MAGAAGDVGVDDADLARPRGRSLGRFDDLDGEFVTHHAGIFEERVLAFEDVIIGAADADPQRAHQRVPGDRRVTLPPFEGQVARLGADKRMDGLHDNL